MDYYTTQKRKYSTPGYVPTRGRVLKGPGLVKSFNRAMARKPLVRRIPRNPRLSYKSNALIQTGENPNTMPAIPIQEKSNGQVTLNSNTLNGESVLQIVRKSTTTQKLTDRDSDVIYLSGVKINAVFLNQQTATGDNALYLNCALISAKAGQTTVSTGDFFTSGAGTNRSSNFDNVALTAYERHTLPINSDNYVVHWHKRFVLHSAQNTYARPDTNTVPKILELNQYVPIKRQIRFDSATGAAETPMFFLHWVGIRGEAASDPVVATTNIYAFEKNIVTYFRNP